MLGIAIDPMKDIFGFSHFSNKLLFEIYQNNPNYELHFHPPVIDGWYACEQIFITLKNNPTERIYLDDFAFSWIKGDVIFSKFTIDSFESKDLLDQLCISFLIMRLRKEYNQLTETNKSEGFLAQYLRKREVENKFILNKFLEVLTLKIRLFSNNFSNKYNVDEAEIFEKALTFASIAITGESKKIIDEQIDLYKNNPKNKKLLRAHNRSFRITPWETFDKNHPFYPKEGNKNRTDIKNIADASCRVFIESFLLMSKMGHPHNMLMPVMLDVFSKDRNLSELTNLTINHNSERIYNPNFKYSLLGFIFGSSKGRSSRIASYLRDTTLRKKNEIQFGQYDPEEVNSENNNFISEYDLRKKRQWKKHSKWQNVSSLEKTQILDNLSFLPYKQYVAIEKYMNGYKKLTINERQNLTKARKKIRENELAIEI